MSSINQQRQRVEQEITALVNTIERTSLRKIQAQMHECSARCYYDNESSMETVQQCVERCTKPLHNAQSYVQNELERLQNRLQRCVLECNDQIKDKISVTLSEDQIAKYTGEFDRCAIKCVDTTVDIIPSLFKTMKSVLAKGENRFFNV